MAAAEIAFAHGLVSRASEALRNAEAMKDAAEEQAKEEMSSVSSSSRGLSLSATSRFARPSQVSMTPSMAEEDLLSSNSVTYGSLGGGMSSLLLARLAILQVRLSPCSLEHS